MYVESWSISNTQPRIQDVKSKTVEPLARPRRACLHFGMVPLGGVGLECVIGSESGSRGTS